VRLFDLDRIEELFVVFVFLICRGGAPWLGGFQAGELASGDAFWEALPRRESSSFLVPSARYRWRERLGTRRLPIENQLHVAGAFELVEITSSI
jgi:hypothetical protein